MHISPLYSVSNRRFNVIILAAGLGSRLRGETDYIPKALVEIGGGRAIDHILRTYQFVAERFVIASGYSADLLENYVRGRHGSLDIAFSRESVDSLSGPGKSMTLALDHASSLLPTIITFCDYLIVDDFSVEADGLCLCRANHEHSIIGSYRTTGRVEEGVVTDLQLNAGTGHHNGFLGVGVFHDTLRLKAIAYGIAARKGLHRIDYARDVVRAYLREVRMTALPIRHVYEFGTADTLQRSRERLDGSALIA